MRAWIIALIIMLLVLSPAGAAAQTPLKISALKVDIWPEYDRPEVLVIYHVVLDPATTLPASMALRIPVTAGDPFNVAVRDPADDQLYNLAYERTIEGDWSVIRFTTTSNELQFEYYDPSITKNGSTRAFTYRWPGDHPITALTIQVQQPVGAENMKIAPSLGSGIPADGGLVYYQAQVGTIPAGSEFAVTVGYDKANDALSVESLRVEPSAPISEQTAGRLGMVEVLPWLLGGLGVLLIGGGAWWYWQSGRSESGKRTRRRHSPARPSVYADEAPAEGVIYCHNCGKRAGPGDNFCRVCGTKLRTE